MMCWTALDRLVQMANDGHLTLPIDQVTRERDHIRRLSKSAPTTPRSRRM